MGELEDLKAELGQLRQQIREQQISQLPPEQRPIFQQQQEIETERQALADYRGRLNEAARLVHAKELSVDTGIDEASLVKFASTAEMDAFAVKSVMDFTKNPALAKLLGAEAKPELDAQGNPVVKPADGAGGTPPAAGASAQPTGAQAGQGAAVLGSDPVAEILADKTRGRGTGNLEGYIESLRAQVPFQEVTFGDPTFRMPGAAPQPAPQQQQAPAPQPAPAPAPAGA